MEPIAQVVQVSDIPPLPPLQYHLSLTFHHCPPPLLPITAPHYHPLEASFPSQSGFWAGSFQIFCCNLKYCCMCCRGGESGTVWGRLPERLLAVGARWTHESKSRQSSWPLRVQSCAARQAGGPGYGSRGAGRSSHWRWVHWYFFIVWCHLPTNQTVHIYSAPGIGKVISFS